MSAFDYDKYARQEQNHERWLSSKFSAYDYAKDARLEAMAFPNRKVLYRKHVDIDKRYERKARYYQICQKWCNSNRNRQIRQIEEKFTKLLQHTLDSTQTKTPSLVSSYQKWRNRSLDQDDFERMFENDMREMEYSNNIANAFKDPSYLAGHESRISMLRKDYRSLSADPVVKSVEVPVNFGRRKSGRPTLGLQKAATSLALQTNRHGLR